MIKLLFNWWRSYQFRTALKRGDRHQAKDILEEIEKSGAKLSWAEQLFKKQSCDRQELASLSRRLQIVSSSQEKLKPDAQFIDFISRSFNFVEHDEYKLQCTGIDRPIFDSFETSLVDFIETEIKEISKDVLQSELDCALKDIEGLKRGLDPQYSFELSPLVYLMKYFIDNVYGAYLAWFLIYKEGLISQNIKILDLAAGPATIAYGLALLLQSSSNFLTPQKMHISYYSLEQQASLQYCGLQFWRRYMKLQETPTNAYFLFDTNNIFDYHSYEQKIPKCFFDFISISHCFFYDPQQRINSHKIYRHIFQNHLSNDGYVLLIVQGNALHKAYNCSLSESLTQEQKAIAMFLDELGLNLEWYKYLTSTDKRTLMSRSEFAKFANNNLPHMKSMNYLKRHYLAQKYESQYVIDDYVILAKP